jgi:phage terminase small subunit
MPFANVYKEPSKGTNNKGKELTHKMRDFIDKYMMCMSYTEAARQSTYITDNPQKLGNRLSQHPLIREEISRRMEERTKKAEIKADYIVNKLVEIIEGDEKTPDRLRAIELAGKTIGIFKDRQEISGPDGEAIRTEQLTKEHATDFTSRISQLAKRAGAGNVVEFPNGRGEGTA